MSDIIHLLPDSIANQIAAGEVVQRPASVVKELLENAIDAQSTHISLLIKDGGKTLVQVIDNGNGMSETDARMSFERHATSKISNAEDIYNVKTMGFRGEALASIAAVSQVSMKTKPSGEEFGIHLDAEGSTIKNQEPVACTAGTAIMVKNLFFNVPARRNFLKSNAVELKHIIDEFFRAALARPDIAFDFFNNDQEMYKLPSGKLSHRIINLFGKNYQQQLIACQEDTSHIKVKGYVGKPDFAKKTRGEQFFFVNNRYIKNGYLNHAVLNAYENLLKADTFPFYALFIEMDPQHIDINVHPTKTEIKLADERTVYAIIRAAIKRALATHNVTPSLDFQTDVNFQPFGDGDRQQGNFIQNSKRYANFHNKPSANQDHWEKLFESNNNRDPIDFATSHQGEPLPEEKENQGTTELTFQSAANKLNSTDQDSLGTHRKFEKTGITFQIHGTYLVTQVKSGMMLTDQQAAHERILYEQYALGLENRGGLSQQCLFPQTIELNPGDFQLIQELGDEIRALGFEFSTFGKNAIIINGIPTDITAGTEKEIFEGLLEQFKKNKNELSLGKKDNIARSMAKRSAIKSGQQLEQNEMNNLIDRLFACINPNYAPDGRSTFFILDLEKINQFFK